MKYVLLGSLSADWAERHGERTDQAKAKLAGLDIKLESVPYTQGEVDFVGIVDAPDPQAMLALSIWCVRQGFSRFRSLPAFDAATMRKASASPDACAIGSAREPAGWRARGVARS